MNKAMLSHDKVIEQSDQIEWAFSLRAIPYPATRIHTIVENGCFRSLMEAF